MEEPILVFSLLTLSETRFTAGGHYMFPFMFGTFKKWRDAVGALYVGNTFGRARLELFTSIGKLRAYQPFRILLLDECASIRIVAADDGTKYLKVQMRNGELVKLNSDNLPALRLELSKVAYPSQFTSITGPTDPDEALNDRSPIDIIDDEANPLEVHVLLLGNPSTVHVGLRDGNYTLELSEKIALKIGRNVMHRWEYYNVVWVATGSYSFGFELTDDSLFEFKCANPARILRLFRDHIKFGTNFPRQSRRRTFNEYLRFYYPVAPPRRKIELSRPEPLGRPPSLRSTDRPLIVPAPSPAAASHPPEMLKSSPVNYSEPNLHAQPAPHDKHTNLLLSLAKAKDAEGNKGVKAKISGFLSFWKKKSPKKATGGRDKFEQNVTEEWVQCHAPSAERRLDMNSKGVQNALAFKRELEQTIAEKEMSRSDDFPTTSASCYDDSKEVTPVPTHDEPKKAISRPQSINRLSMPEVVAFSDPPHPNHTSNNYTCIPLAVVESPFDPSRKTLVQQLAPSKRVVFRDIPKSPTSPTRNSIASADPFKEVEKLHRVELLRSTYIE